MDQIVAARSVPAIRGDRKMANQQRGREDRPGGRTGPGDALAYKRHGSAVPTSAHPRSAARGVNLAPVFRQERPPHRNKAARTPPDMRADEAGSSPATAARAAEADISDPPNGRCRLEG